MTPALRRIVLRLAPESYAYYRAFVSLVLDKKSYLHTTGWFRSLTVEAPMDSEGREIPWMNFPAICFLKDRLANHLTLFEYGSGNSTIFFAGLVRHVTSVESAPTWFRSVQDRLVSNIELIYQPEDTDGDYCRAVHSTGRKFDVIVIDGRDRVNCLRQSLSALTENGVLILDDSERIKYQEGIAVVHGHAFHSIHFEGLKPTHFDKSRMTVFYRSGFNCLGL